MKNIKIINASAGSGKTYSLTTKITELIKDGFDPESLMVTTFTNRAATELHERIRLHLLKDAWMDDVNRISDGFIGTVNSICSRLLKEYAIEAGLSPALEIMPTEDSEIIFKASIDHVIFSYASDLEPVARRLDLNGGGSGYQQNGDWRLDVKRIVDLARSNQISSGCLKKFAEKSIDSFISLCGERMTADLDSEMSKVMYGTIDSLKELSSTKKSTIDAFKMIQKYYELMQRKQLKWSDWSRLSKIKSAKDGQGIIDPVIMTAQKVLKHPLFQNDIKKMITGVFNCASDALQEYDRYKREHGLMDFVDQETYVLDMALNNDMFKASMRNRIRILMVDEFQDTSPIQLALFLALNDLAGKSIWVGDPKQAIYDFRGTDPQLMNDVVSLIGDAGVLDYSWRSREKLLEFTNALFKEVFDQMDTSKVILKIPSERKDQAEGGSREIWHLEAKNNAEECTAIAAGIKDLIERFPGVKPGDIAILCRKNDRCKDIATCLEKLGIRASVGQKQLTNTKECQLAIAALRYMNNKEDSIALTEMIQLISNDDKWYSELMKDPEKAMGNWYNAVFVKKLDEGRENIKYWTPSEALDQAINMVGLMDILKKWPNPELARKNIEALRGVCREYLDLCAARRRAMTVDGFLAYLKRFDTEQVNGNDIKMVNVLTYHGAKGLEWPWVVLTGLDAKPKENVFGANIEAALKFDPAEPLADRKVRYWPWPFGAQKGFELLDKKIEALPLKNQICDKAMSEEQRLLYVGMTRAKDGLVLALRESSDGSLNSAWLDMLNNERYKQIIKLDAAMPDGNIQIGETQMTFDIYSYGTECTNHTDLDIEELEFTPEFPDSTKNYPPARISPSKIERLPNSADDCNFEIIESFGKGIKIAGSPQMDVLGNAIHAYFAVDYADLEEDARNDLAQSILTNWGMDVSIDFTELVGAGKSFVDFLDRRFAEYTTYKEWPVSMRNENNQVIQGWVDLLLETPEGYVIIDHKNYSGEAPLNGMKKYEPQLQMYKKTIEKATGRPVVDMLIHLPISGEILKYVT